MLFLPCPSSLFWPTQPPPLWKHKLGKSFYLKEKLSFTASLLIHIICSTVRQRCSSASDGIDWRVWMRPEINRKWFRLRSPEEFMKPHCKYNTNTSREDLSCADFKDLKGALNGRDLCTPNGVECKNPATAVKEDLKHDQGAGSTKYRWCCRWGLTNFCASHRTHQTSDSHGCVNALVVSWGNKRLLVLLFFWCSVVLSLGLFTVVTSQAIVTTTVTRELLLCFFNPFK